MEWFGTRVRRAMQIVIGGERLRSDPLFDADWYRWAYPDAPRSARGAARHYALVGEHERIPSVDFAAARYVAHSPDIVGSGLNPLVHYVRFGRREGREVRPHFARHFLAEDGRLNRAALEIFLRSGELVSGRGSVLRAFPHLLHGMPRSMARGFGSVLLALATNRPADLGPATVSGRSRGTLDDVSVSIVGADGILASASLAALMVGDEVGRAQVALPDESVPEGAVKIEVTAGALVVPGSLRRLVERARVSGSRVVGVALEPDGAPRTGWDDPEAQFAPVLVAHADLSKEEPPEIVRSATAVWWPDDALIAAANQRPRALVIDDRVPTSDLDSGSNCTVSYLRTLTSLGYRVQFVPSDLRFHARYTLELESWGVEVIDERWISDPDHVVHSKYAIALLVRYDNFESFVGDLRHEQPGTPVLFAPLDLHHVRLAGQGALSGDERVLHDAEVVREAEIRCIQAADATIVLSSIEVTQAQELVRDARVALVPMARDRPAMASVPNHAWADRTDIVFVGSYAHPPNPDALGWFLDEIWPKISDRLPEARFVAYGSGMPDTIRARSTDRALMYGYVEHLDDAFATARIAVAPLRFGAGAKGKLTSSMLGGIPIVSTSVGVDGMDLPEDAIVVADDAASFADAVVELWGDEQRLSSISAAGLDVASTRFSFEAQRAALAALLDDLGVTAP